MARKSFVLMVMGIVIFFLCSVSSGDVPHMINYQGKLTTATGGCLNDTVQMIFSIYPDTLGSPAVWADTQAQVVVKEGVFNVLLGSVNPIPDTVFDGSTKYLGVQVESDPEMRPLKAMVSVAYAFHSATADSAFNVPAAGIVSVDGVSNPGGDVDFIETDAITITPDDGANTITFGETHSARTDNPHAVTAAQTGALISSDGVSNPGGDVDFIQNNSIIITPNDGANAITFGETHSARTDNPHSVTAAQTGALVSVDGVSNAGGDVDFVAGTNMTITPNDGANTITFSATTGGIGGSGTTNYLPKFTAPTTLGNSVIYETGGNVGIGTASPQGKLDISGSLAVAGDAGTAGQILQSQGMGNAPAWTTPSWANTSLSNLSSVAINESLLPFATNAFDLGSSTLRFRTAYFSRTIDISISSIASANALNITHAGTGRSVVINQSNPNSTTAILLTNAGSGRTLEFQQTNSSNGNDMMYLYNAGTGRFIYATNGAYLSNDGVWTDASSREYKKDIRNLTTAEATSALRQLNPVVFKYKRTDEQHVGFIAEDVPDLVATKDRKGQSAMDVVAVLTKIVQEQQKRILALEKKIEELER